MGGLFGGGSSSDDTQASWNDEARKAYRGKTASITKGEDGSLVTNYSGGKSAGDTTAGANMPWGQRRGGMPYSVGTPEWKREHERRISSYQSLGGGV